MTAQSSASNGDGCRNGFISRENGTYRGPVSRYLFPTSGIIFKPGGEAMHEIHLCDEETDD